MISRSLQKMTLMFLQLEAWTAPTGGQSIVGDYTPGLAGTSGPIKINLLNYNASFYPKIMETPYQTGFSSIKYNQDINSGSPLGLGKSISVILHNSSLMKLRRLASWQHWRWRPLIVVQLPV